MAVAIAKGETRKIEFTITEEDLRIINRDMQSVVEPGDFEVMVGAASDDIRLRGTLTAE